MDLKTCTISSPHSNAFIDMNGDCLADLLLTCAGPVPSFQIYTATAAGFQLARSHQYNSGAGPLSFADMDGNGTMDVAYIHCDTKCVLHLWYNQQQQPGALCQGDANFIFRPEQVHGALELDLGFLGPIAQKQLMLGDVNLDGYPGGTTLCDLNRHTASEWH